MSTQAQGVRGPTLRGYRRRKTMLDLNVLPSESRDQEGTSTQDVQHGEQASQQGQPLPPATIDVEAFDDDVIESSPRAFAEAKSNARRNNAQRTHGSAVVVDVDSGQTTRLTYNNHNKRRRLLPNQTIINCEHYVNLESSGSSTVISESGDNAPSAPSLPKEPTFNCPICMGPFVEETSTKCGHIFCKACIKAAIRVQAKCPTCRKKISVKNLIRVFLPATSSL
ncbi:E3 ubiquitin-protein ligase RNF4 [Manihot esculenta]|uniref:RING-type domain-containing protein n=1 Tax=Manihot esculenta TaxID=3983 RepID=A0A251JX94_MANES|nr:E3 ubiquitin-protein ligase RNF4 [Manihot esculenta]XP_021631654.1 E3 ubiquitin-protein ligase RNF4 [Manihot esculenta]OAY32829.1 hypothetical protein MANES_13G049000v8 [Manihot esculenta]